MVTGAFDIELGRDRRHVIGRGEFREPALVGRLPTRGDDREHRQGHQRDGHAERALVSVIEFFLDPRLAEEGHEDQAEHVERRDGRGGDAQDERQVVAAGHAEGQGRAQDAVLGVEAGEKRHAAECQRRDQHCRKRDRQFFTQAAHIGHLLRVHRVDHRTGAEEQEGLEHGVGGQVEHGVGRVARSEGHYHVAELTEGRKREHAFDVGLDQRDGRSDEGRDRPHVQDDHHRVGAKQRSQARNHVDTRGNHGGGMDQGRHRGRTLHGVGQPDVQRHLGRLAHATHEQADARPTQKGALDGAGFHMGEQFEIVQGTGGGEEGQDAQPETPVADTVGQERLLVGVGCRMFVEEEADQQVTGQAHQLPEHVQEEQVVRQHDAHHGEGEKAQEGEEPFVAPVPVHISHRVQVDHETDDTHDHQHDGGHAVDQDPRVDAEAADVQPGEGFFHPVGRIADLPEGNEDPDGQQLGNAHETYPDEVALTRQLLPEEEDQHIGQHGQPEYGQRGIEDGVVAHHRWVSLIASGSAPYPHGRCRSSGTWQARWPGPRLLPPPRARLRRRP